MGDLVPVRGEFTPKELSLIRKTAAKDANETEFEQFISFCRSTRLNPLRKQVYLIIVNKNNPAKRQPVIVTGIDGLRAIADRSGNYRPDPEPPRITYDENLKGPLNPNGIVKAVVTVYKWSHGAWFPVAGEAHWAEFAPIKDVWKEDENGRRVKTGKQELDTQKDGWTRMGHVMISKVAESQALRRGWPEDLSGVYGEEETDRMKTIELTATELADEADKAERLDRIGAHNTILVDWLDGEANTPVPVGKFYDAAMAFIAEFSKPGEEEYGTILQWRDRNRNALQMFWALEKDAALDLKAKLENIEQSARQPA